MNKPTRRTQPSRDRNVEPRLPHERDQSSDEQHDAAAAGPEPGRQAHDDVTRGLRDTDRGPVVDKLYNEQIAPRARRGGAR